MLLTNDEVVQLKSWLVKELESISEADSQILSDYVVALLQAEGSEAELHANAIENLTDFLGNNTKRFVEKVFSAVKSKRYIPGRAASALSKQDAEPRAHEPSSFATASNGREARTISKNRKRKYDDSGTSYVDWDAPTATAGGDRGEKQGIRSSRRRKDTQRGRGHARNSSNTEVRDGATEPSSNNPYTSARSSGKASKQHRSSDNSHRSDDHALVPSSLNSFPGLPDFSIQRFDPNEALRALMTLQAMGFPLPFPGDTANGASKTLRAPSKSPKPCRNYEKNGICLKGSACRFQHKGHQVQGSTDSSTSIPNQTNGTRSYGSSGITPGSKSRRKRPLTSASRRIFVANIPASHLGEASVRDFFMVFGAIASVEVKAGDRAAIVEFEDETSANAAIESPKSVFDNRFVQVSWCPSDDGEKNTRTHDQDDSGTNNEPFFDKELFEAHTAEAQKRYEARKALLEQMQSTKRDLATQEQEIEKLKASEMQKMRDIFEKKGKSLPPDLQQVLDASEGDHQTEQLLAQLKALEDEAKSLGLDHNSWYHNSSYGHHNNHASRGRGSYSRARRGHPVRDGSHTWIRGTPPGNGAYNLDNRPKRIRLGTAELDTSQDEHLEQFLLALPGFESLKADPETNDKSHIITFTDRRAAETFFYSSSDIPNVGPVIRSWVTMQPALPSVRNGTVERSSIPEATEKELLLTSSPEIIVENADQREQRDDAGYASEEYEWIV